MKFATIILVYVIAWWLVFFAVLPFGVRAQNETEEGVTRGTVPSAPSNPNLKAKMLVTSLIAFAITLLYYWLATSGLVSFRN